MFEAISRVRGHKPVFEARLDQFEARLDQFEARLDQFEARYDQFDVKSVVYPIYCSLHVDILAFRPYS